ncbi:MAG: two-component regulator propeller domain-containing protein [Vicinamibacterales bacterium]|jgi:signal transduction histidine kinase/ligand-binding sensor domain-containing protein
MSRVLRISAFGLWLVLWTVSSSLAAATLYRIDTWTTADGLPTNSVNAVLQTRDGFLWLATYGGLVRFDGTRLKTYTTDNTPGLRTGRLISLYESRDGALWLTSEGLGVTRVVDGRFISYSTADGLPDNDVAALFELPDGTLMVDTRKGAVRWDGGRFIADPGLPSLGDSGRAVLGRSEAGAIWYRDAGGLHRFDGGRVTRTVRLEVVPLSAYEDRAGRLWLQLPTAGGDPRRQLACLCDGRLVRYGAGDGLPDAGAISWSEDRDGHVWFGFRGNGGLVRFDGQGFAALTTSDGLPGPNVEKVFQDREGTLWAPTDGGLARLTAKPLISYSAKDGLEHDNTYVVYADRRGDLWIAGAPGLTRYRDRRFEPMSAVFGLEGQFINAIFEDRDGVLWLGLLDGSIRRIANGRVAVIPAAAGTALRAIYQGKGPEVWLGGRNGLARYRDGVITPLAEGYPGGEVHVLHEDRDGALWGGTNAGVVRFRDGRFTKFGTAEGITGQPIVRAIHEDVDGTLWFGTYDSGLLRFRDGRFTVVTTRDGLFATGAFQIIEDRQQRFWITSNAGIYRVSRRELDDFAAGKIRHVNSVAYGTRDGMLHSECNGGTQPAGATDRDGRIWFPTQRGVVVVDPETIPINRQPPPVVITQASVANEPVDAAAGIEIRSGPTALEVQFAALTFVRPEHSRFRYMMEGLDQDWTDAGTERSARYAQLPYGNFYFRVIAANRDGVWNTEGARIAVVVVPPFWRTQWFFALMVIAAAAAAFAGHTWRMKLIRREQDRQKAFSRQLIELQEAERTRIAAGLHDGLQQSLLVIRNWALLAQNAQPSEPAVAQRLREIDGVAAQALNDVRDIVEDLTPHQLERLGLAASVAEMVDTVAASCAIKFECRTTDVAGRLPAAAELTLFRIIQEAVTNLVKHSNARSATVTLEADASVVRVRVQDDGDGFEPGEMAARRGGAGGFGLFGMSERIAMIGGRLAIESAPGKGTVVAAEVPMAGSPM